MGSCTFLLGCFNNGLCLLHFLREEKWVPSFGVFLSREHPQVCLIFFLVLVLSSWDKALCILLIQEFVLVQINLCHASHPDTEVITERNSSKWWSCMGRPLLCLFPFISLVLELPAKQTCLESLHQHGSLCKLYFTSLSLWFKVPIELRNWNDGSQRLRPKWVFCRKKKPLP